MRRLALCVLFVLFATVCGAGPVTYYGYPDASSLPDAGRILLWDGSASKNITGSKLKSEVMSSIGNPNNTPLTKQPSSSSPYLRQVEIKDSTGKITMFINASGQMVFGTPVALAVSSVAPANGATGVSILAPPVVTFNKPVTVSLSTMYIQGNSTAPTAYDVNGAQWQVPATPLTYGATYTLKVVRGSITQTDGETSSSCGASMTDVSGVCQSTWTTALLNLAGLSVDPAATAEGESGTDGGAFTTPVSVTFSTEALLTAGAGSFTCSASYYNGAQWLNDTASGDYASADNLTWSLPDLVYHKSYDTSHQTVYSCSLTKSIGISSCGMTNDTGDACVWTFHTVL